jgi:hypothetical protein
MDKLTTQIEILLKIAEDKWLEDKQKLNDLLARPENADIRYMMYRIDDLEGQVSDYRNLLEVNDAEKKV